MKSYTSFISEAQLRWYHKGKLGDKIDLPELPEYDNIRIGDTIELISKHDAYLQEEEDCTFVDTNRRIGGVITVKDIRKKCGHVCVDDGENGWYRIECFKLWKSPANETLRWYRKGEFIVAPEPVIEKGLKVGDKVILKDNIKSFWSRDLNRFKDSDFNVGKCMNIIKMIDNKGGEPCAFVSENDSWYKLSCLAIYES